MLSIVIPAYNEERAIGACLRSLARQDIDETYEVVLVDNGCTDQTISVARASANGLDLRIVEEPRHGRGAARRTGFLVARGEIVFSADADTVYPASWMSRLRMALKQPGVVAVTTTAKFEDLSTWQNRLMNIAQPIAMWLYRVVVGHHCLSGFSFAVQRAAYEAAGGFDAELNADEDADLSRRVARLGRIRLIHAPVSMSGRRFSRGLIRGAFAYLRLNWQYRFGRRSAHMSAPMDSRHAASHSRHVADAARWHLPGSSACSVVYAARPRPLDAQRQTRPGAGEVTAIRATLRAGPRGPGCWRRATRSSLRDSTLRGRGSIRPSASAH